MGFARQLLACKAATVAEGKIPSGTAAQLQCLLEEFLAQLKLAGDTAAPAKLSEQYQHFPGSA